MSLTRRRLIATSAILPLGFNQSARAAQAVQPKIGDKRGNFDAWFGHGTEAGRFISYPPLSAGRASYHVAYNDEWHSETIVGDFNQLPDGGIEFDSSEIGISQFVPDDGVAGSVFQFGFYLTPAGFYGLRSWHSAQLAADTGGTGIITVLDRIVSQSPGIAHFKETMITFTSEDVHPVTPTGEHIGPHSPREEWQAYPGGLQEAQGGGIVSNPPVPGSWVIGFNSNIQVGLQDPLSTRETAELIGSMLPPSRLLWSAWYGITPVTGTQIRLHVFEANDTGNQFLSAQFVEGSEESGSVQSFHLVNADTR